MKLYEINQAIEEILLAGVDMETGELSPETSRMLDQLGLMKEEKAENIALMLKNLKAEIDAIKSEETALKSRREQKERRREWLWNYLQECMAGEKLETPRVKISYTSSEGTIFTDEAAFYRWAESGHDEFLKYSKPTADKTAIKKAIKDGQTIPGAALEKRQNMQIK